MARVNFDGEAPISDHVDGATAWREAGSGQPVVFLHGLGGSRLAWEAQLRDLGGRFRCLAWDMPGYGDSALLSPLSYEGIADRLVGWLDQLDLDQVDLVGLSFGGMHALHTALAHPNRIGKMVLADTSPAFGMDGTRADEWMDERLSVLSDGGTPADLADVVIDAITHVELTGRIRDETIAAFSAIPSAGFEAAVRCLPTNDIRHRLGEISNDCLVIVGEHDTETPPAYAQVLADGLAHSRLEVIPGVGHLTPCEAPTAFNTLVADFLC